MVLCLTPSVASLMSRTPAMASFLQQPGGLQPPQLLSGGDIIARSGARLPRSMNFRHQRREERLVERGRPCSPAADTLLWRSVSSLTSAKTRTAPLRD